MSILIYEPCIGQTRCQACTTITHALLHKHALQTVKDVTACIRKFEKKQAMKHVLPRPTLSSLQPKLDACGHVLTQGKHRNLSAVRPACNCFWSRSFYVRQRCYIYVIEYIACATHALHAATPHTVQLLAPACFGIYVDLQSTSLAACAAALGFRGLPACLFGCSFLASTLPTGLDSRIACLTYSKLPLDNSM